MLGDRHSSQTVKIPVDWNEVFSRLDRYMDESVKKFGVSVAEIDVRYIVKLDIEEVFGESAVTGITEISPLYDNSFVGKCRARFIRLPDKTYKDLGYYMRHRLEMLSYYYENGEMLNVLRMFAPEDVVKHTQIYPDEAEDADPEVLRKYLAEAISFAEDMEDSILPQHMIFTGVSFQEGIYIFDLELTDPDGSIRKGKLYMQADTGLFMRDDGPVEDAVG